MTAADQHDTTRLATVVGAPAFLVPWLDRFYDEHDTVLVLAAAETALRPHHSTDTGGPRPAELERAWRRGILDRDDRPAASRGDDRGDATTPDGDRRPAAVPEAATVSYRPAGFRTRFEYWAMFEGWKDVPEEVRSRLCDWELAHYVQSVRDHVMHVRVTGHPPEDQIRYDYVLLDEAEAILRRAEHIYLWPCDCRTMVGGCAKPQMVCLRFENDRGVGWEISTERAIEITRAANRAGLIQTAEIPPDDGSLATGALCNCCADCCFPQQASRALNAGRDWPQGHYRATVRDACDGCGRCVRRCPFQAITMAPHGDDATDVPFVEPALCRGCGVCSTGCPQDAIVMTALDGRSPGSDEDGR